MGNAASTPLRVRRRRNDEPTTIELLYTKPSGLYPTCAWDSKLVKRLILRGELAPRYPGRDDPCVDAQEECPICMLVYPVLNETRCCSARLCTECYLQIRPPRHNKEPCPFCKYKRVEATYKGPRDQNEIEKEQMDEKRALDAMKRANVAVLPPTSSSSPSSATPSSSVTNPLSQPIREMASEVATASASAVHEQHTENHSILQCSCSSADHRGCYDDHRARYYHRDETPAIDPLLLEAMASEVTYSSGPHLDRGSASSSGVLDPHVKDLPGNASNSASETDIDRLAPLPRVVRLPWYGVDMSGESAGPSVSPAFSQGDVDEVSLNEAIRRSLIDM